MTPSDNCSEIFGNAIIVYRALKMLGVFQPSVWSKRCKLNHWVVNVHLLCCLNPERCFFWSNKNIFLLHLTHQLCHFLTQRWVKNNSFQCNDKENKNYSLLLKIVQQCIFPAIFQTFKIDYTCLGGYWNKMQGCTDTIFLRLSTDTDIFSGTRRC